jgi:hypothetical protein
LKQRRGHDFGFGFGWWGAYYNLVAGSYNMYLINSVSSSDSGKSLTVENDYSSRGYNVKCYNSNLNSLLNGYAVTNKSANFTQSDINNGTGGWTGTGCKSVDPLFTSLGITWATTNLKLKSGSPNINAGVFPFTAATSGSGTQITLNKLVPDLDARMVFRPGDVIQIEGSGRYSVTSVNSDVLITLSSPASFQAGKGVWLPWPNQKLDIGAMSVNIMLRYSPPVLLSVAN